MGAKEKPAAAGKLIAFREKASKTFVNEDNLQIQLPASEDQSRFDGISAFKKLYNHYLYESTQIQNSEEEAKKPQNGSEKPEENL